MSGASGRGDVLAEAHADDRRNTRLLHGHAIYAVGGLHGARVVGDHQELRLHLELVEQTQETSDVGIVQWRVDLVQQAKGSAW